MQADRLLAKLTVREILTYAAYLRLPGNNSKQDIKRKVIIYTFTSCSSSY